MFSADVSLFRNSIFFALQRKRENKVRIIIFINSLPIVPPSQVFALHLFFVYLVFWNDIAHIQIIYYQSMYSPSCNISVSVIAA